MRHCTTYPTTTAFSAKLHAHQKSKTILMWNCWSHGNPICCLREFSGSRLSSRKRLSYPSTLRDGSGYLISWWTQKLQTWVEHFIKLLSSRLTQSTCATSPGAIEHEIDLQPRGESDVIFAIQTVKNRKSPGEDGVPSKVIQPFLPALLILLV